MLQLQASKVNGEAGKTLTRLLILTLLLQLTVTSNSHAKQRLKRELQPQTIPPIDRTGSQQQANATQQQQTGTFGDLVAIGAISLLDPQAAARASDQSVSKSNSRFQVQDVRTAARLTDRIASSTSPQQQNKLDYIIEFMRQNKLTKFCDLLTGQQPEVRDLNRRLNALSQFTLFVPTNEALLLMPSGQFEQIRGRPEEARQFLLAHATGELVAPKLDSVAQRELLAAARWTSIRSQLQAQRPDLAALATARASSQLIPSLAGSQLRITTTPITTASGLDGSQLVSRLNTKLELIVNGANVLSGHSHALQEPNNTNVTYAIVHLIDRPLYPVPSATLAAKLRQLAPRMAQYLESAQDPALNEALESSQRLSTLLLPTEESFRLIPAGALSQLETNRTFLIEFLRNHLIDDLHYGIQLASPSSQQLAASQQLGDRDLKSEPNLRTKLSATSGLELEFEVKNLPSRRLILVNSIPIVESDLTTINGVVHLIARPIFQRSIFEDCNCTTSLSFNDSIATISPVNSNNLEPLATNENNNIKFWSNSAVDYAAPPGTNELEREESSRSAEQRQPPQQPKVRSQRSGSVLIERNNRDFYRPSVVPANLQPAARSSERAQQVAPVGARRQDNSQAQDLPNAVDMSQDQLDELNRLLAGSSAGSSSSRRLIPSTAPINDGLFEAERYKVLNATTRKQMREQREWQNYTSNGDSNQPPNRFAYDRPLTTRPTTDVLPVSGEYTSNAPGKRLYSVVDNTSSSADNSSNWYSGSASSDPQSSRNERLMLRFQPEDARDLQPTNRSLSAGLAPASSFVQPSYETSPLTGSNVDRKQPTGKTLAPPSGFGGCAFYDADCKRLVGKLVRLPPNGAIKRTKNLSSVAASTSSPSPAADHQHANRTGQHLDSTFGETTETLFTRQPANHSNQHRVLAPPSQPLPPWSEDDTGKSVQPSIAGSSNWNRRQPPASDITRINRQQQQASSSIYLSSSASSSNLHGHGFTNGLGRLEASKSTDTSRAANQSGGNQYSRPPSAQILLVPVGYLQQNATTSTSGASKPQPSGQLISPKPIYFSPPLNTFRAPAGQQQQLQQTFNSLNYHIPTPSPLPELTIHALPSGSGHNRVFTMTSGSSPLLGRLTNFTAIETIPVDEPLTLNANQPNLAPNFHSSGSTPAKNLILRAPVAAQRKSRLQQQGGNNSAAFNYQLEPQAAQFTSPARKIVRLQPAPDAVWPSKGDEFNGDISITSAKLSSFGGGSSRDQLFSPGGSPFEAVKANATGGGLAVQASSGSSNVIRSVPLVDPTLNFQDQSQQTSDFFQNRTIAEIMDDSGLRIDGQQVTFARLKECLRDADLLNLVTQVGSSLTIFMPTDSAFQRLVQQQAIAHQRERSSGGRSTSARLTQLDQSRRSLIPLIARVKPVDAATPAGSSNIDELSGRLNFDPIDLSSATTAAERLTLDCSTSQVRNLLLDHLSARLLTPKQLQSDLILNSLNGQHQLLLSSVASKKIVVVDGQPVIAATRAKNGMVYVVNKFLNLTQQVPNVVDLIEQQPNLTTFLSYLTFSSLSDRLRREVGPLTILAPTNEAFEQLSGSARQLINSDPAALMDVLRAHVVEGAQFGKLIPMRNRLKTMNSDQTIEARVIKPNLYQLDNQMTSMRLVGTTGNGVVNAIDRLIVPSWLKVSMGGRPQQAAATAGSSGASSTPTSALDSSRIMPLGSSGITNVNNKPARGSSLDGELDSSLLVAQPPSLNLPLIGRQPTRFEQPAGSRLVAPPTSSSATNSFLFSNENSGNTLDSFDFPPSTTTASPSSTFGSSSPFLKLANASSSDSPLAPTMANATSNMRLIEKLANLMQAKKFVDLLFKSRVSNLLKPDMNYVILVPTDQAIEKLPRQIIDMLDKDPDRLLDLVNYHILDTTFEYINTIPDGQTLNTLNEKDILFNWHRNNTILTASGAVVLGGIQEENIALLVVDRVLYPTPGDILNIVAKSPILSNFTALVRSAGLERQLALAGPYTLFAPSDFAFNQLDRRDLEFLQRNRETARRFLLRHLSQPAIFTSSIALSNTTTPSGRSLRLATIQPPTMTISNSLGEDLTLRQRNDYFSVNDVNFSYADVAATNGVVHVIDGLL